MKYPTKLFCVVLLVLSLSNVISAADENTYIYDYPEQGVTIQFPDNTLLSTYSRQAIANIIAYDSSPSQTYSLCWLTGHDTITETVTAIYHKVSDYSPRCQLEIYHVTSCTNCDYIYPVLASSQYISCCPPEASAVSLD